MSKLLCDVCGTAYPDTAAQCPICGYAATEASRISADGADDSGAEKGYTYIKGGRFSKANVRKHGGAVSANVVRDTKKKHDEKPVNNKGLLITALLLLVAIVIVVLYITVRFLLPARQTDNADVQKVEQSVTEAVDDTNDDKADEPGVQMASAFAKSEVKFTEAGQTEDLLIDPIPDDFRLYAVESTNEDVVVATLSGNAVTIQAVGAGDAKVKLLYNGNVVSECSVICDIEKKLEIEGKIQLTSIGTPKKILLSDFTASELAQIEWSVDKDKIVTISEDGVVAAVTEGTVTITAKYKGQSATCVVECTFEGDGTGTGNNELDQSVSSGTGGVTEG